MTTTPPAQPEPTKDRSSKWGRLYTQANAVCAKIGADGRVDCRTESVERLMDALHDLDGGQWCPGLEPAQPAPVVPGWQPIETASKGGVLVDILCDGRRYAGCHYDRICDEFRHITACGVLVHLKKASHWMAVPAAPQPLPVPAPAQKDS